MVGAGNSSMKSHKYVILIFILLMNSSNTCSELSEDMYKDGIQSITNVDISHVVITAMQQKHASLDKMTCIKTVITFGEGHK